MKFVYKQIRQRGGGFWKNLFHFNRRKEREEATAEMERRRKGRVISHGPSPQKGGSFHSSGYRVISNGYRVSPGQFPRRRQDNWFVERLKKGVQEGGMRPPSRVFGKRQKDRNDELLKNRYRKMGRQMREFTKHGKLKRTPGRRKRDYDPWSEFTDDFE